VRRANFYGITERNVTHYGMTIEDNVAQTPPASRRAATTPWRGDRAA
jgi:xanthine dehydrogenase molybdopterin-binding subunit B